MPTHPQIIANFIVKKSNDKRSSASISGAIAGIATIDELNWHPDPIKVPNMTLGMHRKHRKLGRSCSQAGSINTDTLHELLLATDDSAWGIRDRGLLPMAYDTLWKHSELVALQVVDVAINTKNGVETTSILQRKSKADQDSIRKWQHLSK